jgi:uncharacterized protein YqgV (UPF0045/DUF77 family)
MYPLNQQYVDSIIDFVKKLRTYNNLEIETNGMSTQVFGQFDQIMSAINKEMKSAFLNEQKIVFNLKVVNSNLQEKPHF